MYTLPDAFICITSRNSYTALHGVSVSSTWQMKEMAGDVAWPRSHNYDTVGSHGNLHLLIQSPTTLQH